MNMGKGQKRIEFKLVGGESEAPKDSGDHEAESFGSIVDTGFSVRQQLTYLASLTIRPTHFSVISARGIIARDQNSKAIFGRTINDPLAPKPVESQTGVIDGSVTLLDGKLDIFGEIDLGIQDTIDSADYESISWYYPKAAKAVPRVFELLNPDSNAYAVTFGGSGKVSGYNLGLTFTKLGNHYFSAGNPYIEADRHFLTLTGEKQFTDNLTANGSYTYERASASNVLTDTTPSPIDRNKINVAGSYVLGAKLPTVSLDYGWRIESSGEYAEGMDTTYELETAREMNNSIGLEARQRFDNDIDYTLKYRFIFDKDLTQYVDTTPAGIGDRWQNEVSGKIGFKIKKILSNSTSLSLRFKRDIKDSLHGFQYKISDNAKLNIIPRKLTLTAKGEYGRKIDDKAGTDADNLSILNAFESELKYVFSSKFSANMIGRYEKVWDNTDGAENYSVKIAGLNVTYLF
jgi:hypothetical protein